MKIRCGFVSNSSSSSFLIYGVRIERVQALKVLGKTEEEAEEISLPEYLETLSYMTCYDPYDGGSLFIGVSWDKVKDDETGKQFKDRIEENLRNKLTGIDLEFDTFKMSWRS